MALGPVLGGALVDSIGWRFVFLVNVPVGIAACILAALYVPESRAAHPRRIDPIGQLLVIGGLASLTYAIIEGQSHGWTSTEIVTLFAVALGCFGLLVPYELRRRQPLLDVRFFRSVPFAGASLLGVSVFASFGGFLFLNTLYLQDVRGLSAIQAGLCTLPIAALTVICSPIAGRILGRHGTRWPLLVAAVSLIASPLLLAGLTAHTPLGVLIVAYMLFGVGFGMVNPPITNTGISGMPPAQAGVAAATVSTSRQVGATIGIALVGALTGTTAGGDFGPAFARATHSSWWLMSVIGVVVLAAGLVISTPWARATAAATAERLADIEQAPWTAEQPATSRA